MYAIAFSLIRVPHSSMCLLLPFQFTPAQVPTLDGSPSFHPTFARESVHLCQTWYVLACVLFCSARSLWRRVAIFPVQT
ncbi:hypothetical protein B0H12DRAFT_1089190, partial [Mycena haematopus]